MMMNLRRKTTFQGLAAAGLTLALSLLVSCTCSYCDVLGSQAASALAPAASYTDAVTTVGTSLTVVPTRSGASITSAAVSTGSLPAGMALGADGRIAGTPTQAGVYPLQIQLCSGGQCILRPVVITVNALLADPINARYADAATQVGTPLSVAPTMLCGGPSTAALLVQGNLPSGMTLNAITGVIAGTPTLAGVYPVAIDLANASSGHVAVPVTITVSQTGSTGLAATYANATGVVGTPLAVTPSVNAGGPITGAALSTGTTPPGMTLNPDGSISGTPTAAGTYTATVTLRNASGALTTQSVTLTINTAGATPLAASYSDVTTTVGSTVMVTPSLVGGGPIVGAQVVSGSLPQGLTLNPDGTLTGTATTAGLYTLEIKLCNAGGGCTLVPLTITVANLPLTLGYATPQTFAAGGVIPTQTPSLGNATTGLATHYALTAGTLPQGLTLNADGTITGTPSTPGVYPFTVTATHGARTASASAVYTVANPGVLTLNYATPLTFTTGGIIPTQSPILGNATPGVSTTYDKTGSFPPGLTLQSDGTITGQPTTPGVYAFVVTATNGARVSAPASVVYTVESSQPLTLVYTSKYFPAGTPITTQNPAIGNETPGLATSYVLSQGPLPTGLNLNGDGTITGTPTVAGVFPFTVTATNGTRTKAANATYTVEVAAPLTLSYAAQTFTQGQVIATQSPVIGNPTPGVTTSYSVPSNTLPPGLNLNGDGTITGTPTTLGDYTFTVTAANGSRTQQATTTYKVVAVPPAALHYTAATYTVGTAIPGNLPNPTGGTPVSYQVIGSLPPGLVMLDPATGIITGNPTTPGTYAVTVRGTNTGGNAEQVFTLTVVAAPTASLSANPSTVPVTQSSSLTALFTGSADGTAVISGGNLATPRTVTSGTSIPTGTEANPVDYTYTLTVTNAASQTAVSMVTVHWVPLPPDTWTVTIPQGGGGPLTPDAGNLLNGQISITVPNQGQSTCGPVTLTVNKEASLPGAIIASARNYSTTFNIASNLGYPFRVPISITLTYDPALSSPALGTGLPVPFYWDPSYNKWVSTGFKAINTTDHTVTFTTLLPGRYAVLGIPSLTPATQSLGFASATDDWRQNNPSTYDLPGGASLGMGSFASWYFPFRKASNGNVGLYNQFPILTDANAQALISRLANGTLDSWEHVWNQQAYSLSDKQTGLALITGLMVTGQPQVFLMGDGLTRPVVNTAVATAIYGYDSATGKFKVMDPNYPGNALTITWSPTSGAFSAYDRAAGYLPALTQFAFEGQTSVHRLADYDRVFSGASAGFPTATFATVEVTSIGGVSNPDLTQTVSVASSNNVVVSGTVTNGDESASQIFWSQNGNAPRTAVDLTAVDATHSSFTFTIPALSDAYGTTVALETTATPCDPTFSHSGFQKFQVKQTTLTPWFVNSCFENGLKPDGRTPVGWTLEQGSNDQIGYPASPSWDSNGNMVGYAIPDWTIVPADSAIVHGGNDPYVAAIPMVLDGGSAFRVNNIASGAHISRLYQSVTVPPTSTVAMPKLSFYWAAAMENPSHAADQQPYVDILVQDVTNGYEKVYYQHFYAGDPTYPGWITGSAGPGSNHPPVMGIPWQKVSLNLGTTRGNHVLKITVTAADCNQTGHGAVAYIDNIGCQ